MCDTMIATRKAAENGVAVFAKNSDRPPNEGQHMAFFPAADHAAGEKVRCTYIEIPQVRHTHAVLLSKPFWMWGAEMGVNEHGLVIGNEAVFSKVPASKTPALLGMDLLRAALERAKEPREAVQVIIDLLEQFGQGGNCDYGDDVMYYHNSFLVANAEDAWVLETVDKQWAARQVKDFYSISNCLTLGGEYDIASPGLVDHALQKGFSRSKEQFHLARDYSDFIFTTFGAGRDRRETTYCILEEQKGKVSAVSLMETLRHHKDPAFDPQKGITGADVCMHAGFGPIRGSQSTASLVVHLDGNRPLIFATGTSAPCTSVFKPIWMDSIGSVDLGPVPSDKADSSLFWTHEKLHRATLLNYAERIRTYAADRAEMEARFTRQAFALHRAGASASERADFTRQCWTESMNAEAEWLKRVQAVPARRAFLNSGAWDGFNRKAGLTT